MKLDTARLDRMVGATKERKVLRIDIAHGSNQLGAQLWRLLTCIWKEPANSALPASPGAHTVGGKSSRIWKRMISQSRCVND